MRFNVSPTIARNCRAIVLAPDASSALADALAREVAEDASKVFVCDGDKTDVDSLVQDEDMQGLVEPSEVSCFNDDRMVRLLHSDSKRLGLLPRKTTMEQAHDIFEATLDSAGPGGEVQWDSGDMLALHLGLVRHGREICAARRPRCEICPLLDLCPRVGVDGAAGKARQSA